MSIYAGFDIGTETVKLVILNEGEMTYAGTVFAGIESISEIAEKLLEKGMRETGISPGEIRSIGGTGINTGDIPIIKEDFPEATCSPMGLHHISPEANLLLDVGASKFTAMKCQDGRAVKISKSDKCASGVGISLRMVADVLAMRIEDIGRASLKSEEAVTIQSTCSVFAETEIISLLHHYRKKAEDILMGYFRGMASRFYSLLLQTGSMDDIWMIGGVAKNEGVVKAIKEITGRAVHIPPDPSIIGALGAALAVSNEDLKS